MGFDLKSMLHGPMVGAGLDADGELRQALLDSVMSELSIRKIVGYLEDLGYPRGTVRPGPIFSALTYEKNLEKQEVESFTVPKLVIQGTLEHENGQDRIELYLSGIIPPRHLRPDETRVNWTLESAEKGPPWKVKGAIKIG